MNNKITLIICYAAIFVVTCIVTSQYSLLKLQNMGQVFGLGAVVVGYFANKIFKK